MNWLSAFLHRHRGPYFQSLGIMVCIWYWFCLPTTLFDKPHSTVLLDRHGILLGARVADDGQWRFPESHQIPKKFEVCLLEFEDRHFYSHYGVSAKSISRAVMQNVRNRQIVSGASTITMQVARMLNPNKDRGLTDKLLEMVLATRLETRFSKKEILSLYCANAPFGNNVVGLEAASWRYFGRPPDKLSWGECATLAVLPNAPGLIYPGKNHRSLLAKRNRLLKRLRDQHKISNDQCELALLEPIPPKPLALPERAAHLLQQMVVVAKGKTVHSTVDADMQMKAQQILKFHADRFRSMDVKNAAVVIASTSTGEVLCYLGNMPTAGKEEGKDVDCAKANRSTGSILKPLLFEAALEDELITPKTLLMDVPSRFGAYSPNNFSKSFEGVVAADKALQRSLNIPFVRLLKEYGAAKFCNRLREAGLNTIEQTPGKYGLTLILGGAEVNLAAITGVYRNMGATVANARPDGLHFIQGNSRAQPATLFDAACTQTTLDCMTELGRPDEEGNWKLFASSRKVAWKTGTSFGFRDAWSVGISPDFTVGVWIGNADGEGRPGLTGIKAAAPVMFDLFSMLPHEKNWFTPDIKLIQAAICKESGMLASENCPHIVREAMPKSCENTGICFYHKILTLSPNKKYTATATCFPVYQLQRDTFFVLPPLALKYYRQHANLEEIPPLFPGCLTDENQGISIVYPRPGTKIYVPKTETGERGEVVFEATVVGKSPLFWHLDDDYLGSTTVMHNMQSSPPIGHHVITVVDGTGRKMSIPFDVIN